MAGKKVKIVISGGPSTGKTSVIEELKKEFKIFEEIARNVLSKKEFSEEVQKEIFEKQLKQCNESDRFEEIMFFDRGLGDSLGYMKLNGFEIPENFLELSKPENTGYDLIFLLDFVSYKNDEIRLEGEEKAKEIHKMIYNVYEDLGYKIIQVPLMSIEERVRFIKKFI